MSFSADLSEFSPCVYPILLRSLNIGEHLLSTH